MLRKLIPHVYQIPADDRYPDCCFLEDTTVLCDSIAWMTHMGHKTRRGESDEVADVLKSWKFKIHRQMTDGSQGTMDGGDVLFTGQEYFVGLSSRTTATAVDAMRTAFGDTYPVTALDMNMPLLSQSSSPVSAENSQPLHLKSIMTVCGKGQIAVADTPLGRTLFHHLNGKSVRHRPLPYQPVWIPAEESAAANFILIDDRLLYRSDTEYPKAARVLSRVQVMSRTLNMSEMGKADGALTCCSLLVPQSHRMD